MKRTRSLIVFCAALGMVLLLQWAAQARAQSAKAFILDSEAPAVTSVDLVTGKTIARLALSGRPARLLRTTDGSRLVVFDPGPGEDKKDRGYKATGKSVATIIDPATMSIVARVELGSGVEAGHAYLSPDSSRFTVLCPGYEAKNPAESQARELVAVDLATGREAGRLALEHGSIPIVRSKDGRTLPLIQGLPRDDKFPFPRSRLWIVDLAGPSVAARLDMGTWVNLYTDGAHFYLLDPGKPDKSPQKNRNGTVQVASLEKRALAGTLDAGRGPRGLYQDEKGGQVFIPSDGPPGAPEGQLRVVRGADLVATLNVATNPKLLQRAGEIVYVVGEKAVTLVDPAALQVTATIPLTKGADRLVDDDDLPTELAVSADGKRAFILYGLHNKVAVLDLEGKRAVGSTKTGRGGKKLFGNVMGGMFGMAGFLVAGYSPWSFAGPSMLALRPDGRFAYALNSQTKDVTVVDATTGESVAMIGGGGYALKVLAGGTLAVVSGDKVQLIDTAANAKAEELELADLRGLAVTPEGAHAVALAKRLVVCLDGVTGKVIGRLTDFVNATDIVFESPNPEP
jgi:DNA-binding beta-propeller fold protein YncE